MNNYLPRTMTRILVVDDEMDGDSSLNYRYIIHGVNGEIIHSNDGRATASVRYHNGSGSENVFEGTIDLLSDSDIDESEIDDFLDLAFRSILEYSAEKLACLASGTDDESFTMLLKNRFGNARKTAVIVKITH